MHVHEHVRMRARACTHARANCTGCTCILGAAPGDVGRHRVKGRGKLGAREGQAVVDAAREVVDGALGRLPLGRVARGAIVLGDPRQDALHVALGAERARVDERPRVEHAAAVDVPPRLDRVERAHL